MLERPDLEDKELIASLQHSYGIPVVQVMFLPLGADFNTAVYRAVADDQPPYFVKLRRGLFDETSVTLPKLLSDQGVEQIIAPLATKTGQLWARLHAFTVIVYPFVEGLNGHRVALSDRHWRDFGAALKQLHTAFVPPTLARAIQRETYDAHGRNQVRRFLLCLDGSTFDDHTAIRLAAFLKLKRHEIIELVERAERFALALQAHAREFTVCHSDAHAGNVLIDSNDHFYIVDWDNPIFAPKERDLMFVGGGQGFIGYTPQEEERLFYEGYGQTQIDPIALAYYRFERIIQDIAIYCEQIFMTAGGAEDREQSLRYLISNFQPGDTIERAYAADPTMRS